MNRTTSLLVASLALAASAGRPVIKIWAGEENAFFLREDSTVYGIGRNDWSQLGRIHTEGVTSRNSGLNRFGKMFQDPEFPIGPNLYGAVSIVPAPTFTLAVLNDHTVWATGENSWGQHANGIIQPSPAFTQVLEGMDSVAAGDQHALYLGTDGVLKAAGRNHKGQLGLPADGLRRSALVTVTSGVRAVWAVGNTSFFVKTDGSVWAMGENVSGLIPGSTAPVVVNPVRIPGVPSSVVGVRASRKHAVALLADGRVWGWGSDENGALSGTATLDVVGPRAVIQSVSTLEARDWGTLVQRFDGSIRSIMSASRDDLTKDGVFTGGGYLFDIDIAMVIKNDLDEYHLMAWACGSQNCYWDIPTPRMKSNRPLWYAGVWETDGSLMPPEHSFDGQGRRKIGSYFSFGYDGSKWDYVGELALLFPGEIGWVYAANTTNSLQHLEYNIQSGISNTTRAPYNSGMHVLRSKSEAYYSDGRRIYPYGLVYLYDPTQSVGCRFDEDYDRLCANPLQAAVNDLEESGQSVVFIESDPDGVEITSVEVSQPVILVSNDPDVAISLSGTLDGSIFAGMTIRDGESLGQRVNMSNVVFIDNTLETPFGVVNGVIAGCVIRQGSQNTSEYGFLEFSGKIIDSKVEGWGRNSSGQIPRTMFKVLKDAEISNAAFLRGNFVAAKVENTKIDNSVFLRIGRFADGFNSSGEIFDETSRSTFERLWIGAEQQNYNNPYSWGGYVRDSRFYGVSTAGVSKIGTTLSGNTTIVETIVSAGQTQVGSSSPAGVFESGDEIEVSSSVVGNHRLGGGNLFAANSRGRYDRILAFGNALGNWGAGNWGIPGRQESGVGYLRNSFFFGNSIKNAEPALVSVPLAGEISNTIIDGVLAYNVACQSWQSSPTWRNNTFLAPPCGGSLNFLENSHGVGVMNSLLVDIYGALDQRFNRFGRDVLGAPKTDLHSLMADPDGEDDLRETWWDNDYSPKNSGPLIDAGSNNHLPHSDYDLAGYPRVSGAAIDIGAYELTDLATYTLQIQSSEGGQTLPAEFAIAMPENGHKVQVVASPFNMWNFVRWEFDAQDVSVENPLSPTTMVTLTKNASIKAIFRKTPTLDDPALKFIDPLLDDWNPSCEFAGAPHWDFQHGTALHFGDKRMQMVLEAAPFRAQLATDGGVRVYLDVLEQPGMNVYDYRFKIRAKRGGGWFVTRERWDVSGPKPKWKFDGDSRVDATVGAIAANTTLQTSLDGPFTKHTYVQAGGLFEIAMGLPQSVAKTNVGLWIEGAGDRFVTAATPLSYTWEGPGASFTIDGNLQDWLAPVPGADP